MKVVSPAIIYPPVGHCIYCGKFDVPLSDEHIVPYGLGGNWILQRASCETCAKQTGRVEQYCLRKMLRPYRLRHGIPHKARKPKEQPKELPLEVVKFGKPKTWHMIPVGEYPSSLILPRYPEPGIFTNRAPDANITVNMLVLFDERDLNKHRGQLNADGFRLGDFHIGIFAQMLAKIAQAYVVASQTVPFKPLLKDAIIHGRAPLQFVGTEPEISPVTNEKSLHKLESGPLDIGGRTYMVARIRLFSGIATPTYIIVVGEF